MLNLRTWFIQRQPTWLTNALNLSTSEVPRGVKLDEDLATRELAPSIGFSMDPYQNGISLAREVLHSRIQLSAGAATSRIGGAAVDVAGECGLVIAVSCDAGALAATRHFRLVAEGRNQSAQTLAVDLTGLVDVVSGGFVGWKNIAGDASARIYIPPNWTVLAVAQDLVGGEILFVDAAVLRLPAGFKPY